MENEYVPYDVALAMKELGFDESCLGFYYTVDKEFGRTSAEYKNSYFQRVKILAPEEECISAPLYQQAFRWFREKYYLYHSIDPLGFNMCLGKVGKLGELLSCNVPNYGTYEEAELACLRKLIEIVKNKED